jgi:hypothetical protein
VSQYPGTLLPHKPTVEETRRGLLDLLAKINAEADKVLALQDLVSQALNTGDSPTFAGLKIKQSDGLIEFYSTDGLTRYGYIQGRSVDINFQTESGPLNLNTVSTEAVKTGTGGIETAGNITLSTAGATVDGQDLTARLDQNVKTTDSPTFASPVFTGYTTLGTGNPAVKLAKFTGTTASTQGGSVTVAHGLTGSKILGVSCGVAFTTNAYMTPGLTTIAGYEFNCYVDGTNINVINKTANSANILSKSFVCMIIYES